MNLEWLFLSNYHPDHHITEKQFYKIMERVGDLLGINYLGNAYDTQNRYLSDIYAVKL